MLNYDGTVAYELDKNDFSLKVDGTPSDITDSSFEGNVMIGIPKVYWKIVDNGDNTANVYIANKRIDDSYHCWSHIDNNGDEIPYKDIPGSKHLFRFDSNDFYDNIIDTRVGAITSDIFPPKFGEGYCRTVKFMIENYSDIMNINVEL
jgi:hypothetical protein